jgi:hypothetical protein
VVGACVAALMLVALVDGAGPFFVVRPTEAVCCKSTSRQQQEHSAMTRNDAWDTSIISSPHRQFTAAALLRADMRQLLFTSWQTLRADAVFVHSIYQAPPSSRMRARIVGIVRCGMILPNVRAVSVNETVDTRPQSINTPILT